MNVATLKRVYSFLLFLSILAFSFYIIYALGNYFFESLLIISVLIAALFIAYFAFFISGREMQRCKAFVYITPFLIISLFFLQLLSPVGASQLESAFKGLYGLSITFFFFIPALFSFFFGGYLIRSRELGKARMAGIALLLFGATILYLFYTHVITYYSVDDEVLYAFKSVVALFNNTNPYTLNFGNSIYGTSISVTMTSYNKIISIMDYPPLFFLVDVPFYLPPHPIFSLSNIGNVQRYQAFTFAVIYLLALTAIVDREALAKPTWLLFFGAILFFASLSAIANVLMLTLLLLSYAYANSRYGWVFMGLAASLQEELWLPLLMIILYSFFNYGRRRGTVNLLGTFLVFALFSLPFAAPNAAAYARDVFSPLSSYILPSGFAPVGYLLATLYPMPLRFYEILFSISALLMLIILLYTNEKRLIGILSFIPFLFLQHAISSYFVFFTSFAIITLFIGDKERKGEKRRASAQKRLVLLSLSALLVVAAVAVVVVGHAEYARAFDISAVSQQVLQSGNRTIYTLNLTYARLSENGAYMLIFYYTNSSGFELLGLGNNILLGSSGNVTTSASYVDPNFIPMNRTSGRVSVEAVLGARTEETIYVRAMLFTNGYVYMLPTVSSR